MSCIAVIILHVVSTWAHTAKLVVNRNGEPEDLEYLVDKLVNALIDERFAWTLKASPVRRADLAETTFRKPSVDSRPRFCALGFHMKSFVKMPWPPDIPEAGRGRHRCGASSLNREMSAKDAKSLSRRYGTFDWLEAIFTVQKSIVAKRILYHVLFNVFLCNVVLYIDDLGYTVDLPVLPHQLLGVFLGLLLVFRTEAAYDRFWEARTAWSEVNNDARNIAVAVASYVQPYAPNATDKILDALAEFMPALSRVCRSDAKAMQEPLRATYRMNEGLLAAATEGMKHFNQSSVDRAHARMYTLQLSRLAELVGSLSGHAGRCSLIANTPIPLSYSRHASRFLTLWCGTLPWVLAPKIGYTTLPVLACTCWMLFGIEELGHLIEQPFVDQDARVYDVSLPSTELAKEVNAAVRYHSDSDFPWS